MKPLKALLLAVMLIPVFSQAQKQASSHSNHHQTSKHQKDNSKVRGVTFDDFKASVADFADSTKAPE